MKVDVCFDELGDSYLLKLREMTGQSDNFILRMAIQDLYESLCDKARGPNQGINDTICINSVIDNLNLIQF